VTPPTDYPIRLFRSARHWEVWLARNFDRSRGLWLRIAKKDVALTSVTYVEALDVALCHGWIDSKKLSHDHLSFLQKFTPRGRRSIWSKINCGKVELLIAAGRMRKGGHAAVAAAKADGRWDAAYQPQRVGRIPPDLARALSRHPRAKAHYAALSSQNRYAILFRVTTAKQPETRARRIAHFVRMLGEGKTLHPQRRPLSKKR